jgi:holo-[acyl-carrier protein] synthase
MKALGVGLGAFKLREVEVVRRATGEPALVLHGAAAALAQARGVQRWHVSLTHTALTAQAIALAE